MSLFVEHIIEGKHIAKKNDLWHNNEPRVRSCFQAHGIRQEGGCTVTDQEICVAMKDYMKDDIRSFGLGWPIEFRVADCQEDAGIRVDVFRYRHVLWLSPEVRSHIISVPDIRRGLARASLAERIDPLFASPLLIPDNTAPLDPMVIQRMKHQLRLAWMLTDLWVSDEYIRCGMDGRLRFEHQIFTEVIKDRLKCGERDELRSAETIVFVATDIAEMRRFSQYGLIPFDYSEVIPRIGECDELNGLRAEVVIASLVDVYRTMPKLAYDRTKDLPVLERFVQRAAWALGLPFKPALKTEGGISFFELR